MIQAQIGSFRILPPQLPHGHVLRKRFADHDLRADMKPALACLAAVALACSKSSSSPGFSERDSAGVHIAENRSAASAESWTVTREPLVEIGAVEGDSAQLLNNVEGAVAVGNDRIVIANGAVPLLRWFDRAGKHVTSTGRTGGGPGEFESLEGGSGNIYALWPLGADSVATWEHSPRRMQVFDAQGRFVRSVTLEAPSQTKLPSYPQLVGRHGRHNLIAFHSPHRESVKPTGVWRDTMAYTWWSEEGKYTGTSIRLPGFSYFMSEFRGRKYPGRPPLALVPAAWADSGRLYYGAGDRFEIAVYEASGSLSRLIRKISPRRAVNDAAIASYIEEQMKGAPNDPALRHQWEASLRQAPFPDSLPAYRRLRVDRTGALWVQDYDMPGEQNATWQVFDRAGHWLSTVTVPRAWQIQDIGADYLLVVARNDMDVEMVRMYGLRRGAANQQ
jgi:hypothetical protein